MVEYETIGIIVIIVGALSVQVRQVNENVKNMLKSEVRLAERIHKEFEKDIQQIKDHLGIVA